MIRLSLPRWITVRARVFAALVAVLACAGLACESRVCTAIGCIDGLVIHFNGTLEAGRTYDLVLTEQTPAGESQFMTCTLLMLAAPAGTSELDCSSSVSHQEIGTMLQIRRNDIGNLTVVVSSAGTELLDVRRSSPRTDPRD